MMSVVGKEMIPLPYTSIIIPSDVTGLLIYRSNGGDTTTISRAERNKGCKHLGTNMLIVADIPAVFAVGVDGSNNGDVVARSRLASNVQEHPGKTIGHRTS